MPIYYKGRPIQALYHNGRYIKEAWYGGRKVFSATGYPIYKEGELLAFGDKRSVSGVVYMFGLPSGKPSYVHAFTSEQAWELSATEKDLSPKRSGTSTTWKLGAVYSPGQQVQVNGYYFVCTAQHYASNATRPLSSVGYFRPVLV